MYLLNIHAIHVIKIFMKFTIIFYNFRFDLRERKRERDFKANKKLDQMSMLNLKMEKHGVNIHVFQYFKYLYLNVLLLINFLSM